MSRGAPERTSYRGHMSTYQNKVKAQKVYLGHMKQRMAQQDGSSKRATTNRTDCSNEPRMDEDQPQQQEPALAEQDNQVNIEAPPGEGEGQVTKEVEINGTDQTN